MTRDQRSLHYVLVVQAAAYALGGGRFATESAFAVHLKELRAALGPRFTAMYLVAPQMTEASYAERKNHLATLDPGSDGIEFIPAHAEDGSLAAFWFRDLPRIRSQLSSVLRSPAIIHSGMSDDIRRPLMAIVNLMGWIRRRPVMFIVDIDFREDTRRYRKLGVWRMKRYLYNRLVMDPLKLLQVFLAPRMFELVLLKSPRLVRDFGRGREHVKNFYDTVHSPAHLLPEPMWARHFERLKNPAGPFVAIYFGRFVEYKGLRFAVDAVRIARELGGDIRLVLVGDGECRQDLMERVAAAGLEDRVTFVPPVPYGPELFDLLAQAHVAVATPLVEDTPRAAFDSMARGLPLVAFKINYFRDLAEESGAVSLVDWADPRALATRFLELDANRAKLVEMSQRALEFAAVNTQSEWIARRVAWMDQFLVPRLEPA